MRAPETAREPAPAEPGPFQIGVLRVVLASCARQGFTFEEAWRIAVPVVLHGLDESEATGWRRRLRASETRIAAIYDWRLEREAPACGLG